MEYENLKVGEVYILKCDGRDLIYNIRQLYNNKVYLPISPFVDNQYFYIMFIYNKEKLNLRGVLLEENSKVSE